MATNLNDHRQTSGRTDLNPRARTWFDGSLIGSPSSQRFMAVSTELDGVIDLIDDELRSRVRIIRVLRRGVQVVRYLPVVLGGVGAFWMGKDSLSIFLPVAAAWSWMGSKVEEWITLTALANHRSALAQARKTLSHPLVMDGRSVSAGGAMTSSAVRANVGQSFASIRAPSWRPTLPSILISKRAKRQQSGDP